MDKSYCKTLEMPIILEKLTFPASDQVLFLNDMFIFPHNMDGFHIWEAGIVLSRFIIFNKSLFEGKKVLELGTGVGIGGIAVLKYTKAKEVTLSDYRDDILRNVEKNIIKNAVKHKHVKNNYYEIKSDNCTLCGQNRGSILNLNWLNFDKFDLKYDIIVGSDLIYKGAPLKELANLIICALNLNGQAYILVPSKRGAIEDFIKFIDESKKVKYEKIELLEGKFYQSPLDNEEEGFKYYPGLKELVFSVYIITKILE